MQAASDSRKKGAAAFLWSLYAGDTSRERKRPVQYALYFLRNLKCLPINFDGKS